jgi:hypothetical protein
MCTCYQAWSSILPPPPCPVAHSTDFGYPVVFEWESPTFELVRVCAGRHCSHCRPVR